MHELCRSAPGRARAGTQCVAAPRTARGPDRRASCHHRGASDGQPHTTKESVDDGQADPGRDRTDHPGAPRPGARHRGRLRGRAAADPAPRQLPGLQGAPGRAGRRERPYDVEVSEPSPGATLVERDRGSSLVTTWTLTPTLDGTATDVKLSTTWQGGGGVGGFFERTFAPKGLRRIYEDVLGRLAQRAKAAPTS